MALEFNVGLFLPPATSHDKYGDPPSSCTREQRGPSTCWTWHPGRLFKSARFQDPAVKCMLSKLQNLGKVALPKDKLQEIMKGARRSPGACFHPRGGWASWWGDRVSGAGRRLVGQGQSFLWGRREAEAGGKLPRSAGGTSAGGESMARACPG